MSSVYIVVGGTGEYSDYTDWNVKAFLSREAAESLCSQLNAWCVEHKADPESSGKGDSYRQGRGSDCPLDGQFRHDSSTGTRYGVAEVELDDAQP